MEITANASQAIKSGNNVLFSEIRTPGNCSILYQNGSGLVTLRGLYNGQCRARFRIHFTGNINADSSSTISGITLLQMAISQNGENIPVSTMISTVADNTSVYNIGTDVLVDVPTGCCQTIAVKNITSNITVDIQNANLIVERVA